MAGRVVPALAKGTTSFDSWRPFCDSGILPHLQTTPAGVQATQLRTHGEDLPPWLGKSTTLHGNLLRGALRLHGQ